MAIRIGRILEFLIIGICLGVTEDIIAIKATTGAMITWTTVGIIVLISIPFAILSELVVDHFKPFKKKNKKNNKNKLKNKSKKL